MSQKKFNVIVAVDKENGIGKEYKLPWNLRSELRNCIKLLNARDDKSKKNGWIWGRKSFVEYMVPGKSNTKRRIIVMLTRDKKKFIKENPKVIEKFKELVIFEDFDKALTYLSTHKEVANIWSCGGASVYKTSIGHKMCENIYITKIFKDYECDQFFEKIDEKVYKEDTEYDKKINEEKGVKFQFQLFKRL